MPSIPQSLLWISLVVLWLFVLVPMLINKRDTVRRTSDVALATRVLNGKSRLIKRAGPAAGHRHDPSWRRLDDFEPELEYSGDAHAYEAEEYPQAYPEEYSAPVTAPQTVEEFVIAESDLGEAADEPARAATRSVVVIASVTEQIDPDYLDVDFVEEDSGALPVGAGMAGVQGSLFDDSAPEPEAEPEPEPVAEDLDDAYEYVDDSSGLEEADEPAAVGAAPGRRRRLDSTATAAAVDARKYRFRKRVLTIMTALMALSAVLAFTVSPALWWVCGATAGVTVLYLGYLRRQTRIEAQVRRRRQQRMTRSRTGEESVAERVVERDRHDFDVVPTRLQRPGAVVLDIDDEDPIFEHLDEVPYSRRDYGTRGMTRDLPRASGQ